MSPVITRIKNYGHTLNINYHQQEHNLWTRPYFLQKGKKGQIEFLCGVVFGLAQLRGVELVSTQIHQYIGELRTPVGLGKLNPSCSSRISSHLTLTKW